LCWYFAGAALGRGGIPALRRAPRWGGQEGLVLTCCQARSGSGYERASRLQAVFSAHRRLLRGWGTAAAGEMAR